MSATIELIKFVKPSKEDISDFKNFLKQIRRKDFMLMIDFDDLDYMNNEIEHIYIKSAICYQSKHRRKVLEKFLRSKSVYSYQFVFKESLDWASHKTIKLSDKLNWNKGFQYIAITKCEAEKLMKYVKEESKEEFKTRFIDNFVDGETMLEISY